MQAIEQEYGCKLCIGPCTTRGEVRAASVYVLLSRTRKEETCSL